MEFLQEESELCAEIYVSHVPVIADAWELISVETLSIGTRNNMRMLAEQVAWDETLDQNERWMLCDAQTSGGLLIAVSPEKKDKLLNELENIGCFAVEIGKIRCRLNNECPLIVRKQKGLGM